MARKEKLIKVDDRNIKVEETQDRVIDSRDIKSRNQQEITQIESNVATLLARKTLLEAENSDIDQLIAGPIGGIISKDIPDQANAGGK